MNRYLQQVRLNVTSEPSYASPARTNTPQQQTPSPATPMPPHTWYLFVELNGISMTFGCVSLMACTRCSSSQKRRIPVSLASPITFRSDTGTSPLHARTDSHFSIHVLFVISRFSIHVYYFVISHFSIPVYFVINTWHVRMYMQTIFLCSPWPSIAHGKIVLSNTLYQPILLNIAHTVPMPAYPPQRMPSYLSTSTAANSFSMLSPSLLSLPSVLSPGVTYGSNVSKNVTAKAAVVHRRQIVTSEQFLSQPT